MKKRTLAVLDAADHLGIMRLLESNMDDLARYQQIAEIITFALEFKSRLPNGQILTALDPAKSGPSLKTETRPAFAVENGSLVRVEGVGLGIYVWFSVRGQPAYYVYANGELVRLGDPYGEVVVLQRPPDMTAAALAAIELLERALDAVEADETARRESWPDEELDLLLGRDMRKFLGHFRPLLVS